MANTDMISPRVTIREHTTPLGNLWSHWTPRGLLRLDWYPPDTHAAVDREKFSAKSVDRNEVSHLDELLTRFFESGQTSFQDIRLDSSGWSKFAGRVYACCRQIPASVTWTYQQLAVAAGSPRASRAVGAAMARNRVPLVIPCHRVISTGGGLRGFSAPGGLETKQRLLALERNGH